MTTYSRNRINPSACVSVLDYGATGDGVTDDYAAVQAALNFAVDNRKSLLLPRVNKLGGKGTYFCGTALTVPNGWKGLHIVGEGGGSASFTDDYVAALEFNNTNGLIVPLTTNVHEQVTIERLVFRNRGTKSNSAIKFLATTGRAYNYPIGWWLDLLSFDRWNAAVHFTQTGGTFFNDAFLGRMSLTRLHTWDTNYSVWAERMFLNLFSMHDCRFHVGGTLFIENGGGDYSLYDCHWEAAPFGRILMKDAFYETKIHQHSCGSELCGTVVSGTGYNGLIQFTGSAPSRAVLLSFSGLTTVPGAFEAPPDCNNFVRLQNSANSNITVRPYGCYVETPQTVSFEMPPVSTDPVEYIRWAWCLYSAYGGAGVKRYSVAQPMAGTRTGGLNAISALPTTTWPFIESGNAQYTTNEAVPNTPDMTDTDRVFVVSFAAEMTEAVSRLGNPITFSVNGNAGTRFTGPFYGPTELWSCSIFCRSNAGSALTPVEVSLLSAGRASIGYGCWHPTTTKSAVEYCHPAGYEYPVMRAVPDGATNSITPRGVSGDLIAQKITLHTQGGYHEMIATGICGNNATKSQATIISAPPTGVTFTNADGAANDYGGVDITNASGAEIIVSAVVKL